MKKFYLVLCAALFAVATFAVEYSKPDTIWHGQTDNYGMLEVDLSVSDLSAVADGTIMTFVFGSNVNEENANLQLFTSTKYMGVGGEEGVHYLSIGINNYSFIVSGEDVSRIQEDASGLSVRGYNLPAITTVVITCAQPQSPTTVVRTFAENVYVHDKRIVAPSNAQIYNITGQNVTHFNGQLSKGIYVVRCDKQTVKVVVK